MTNKTDVNEGSAALHCYAAIESAIMCGKYVRWKDPWSDGFVLAVEGPEWLVLTTCGEHLPFRSGFEQAIALGYKFEACKEFAV